MARKSYTAGQKLSILRTLEQRINDNPNLSKRSVARELGVDHNQLRRWQEKYELLQKQVTRTPGTHFYPGALSLNPGAKSSLHHIEDDLVRHIYEDREQGFAVSIKSIVVESN